MTHLPKQKGFTIVELLIVVVVIAILAAITVVAFTGINERAKQSAAQSNAAQVAKKVAQYAVENGDAYPASEAAFLTYAGLTETADTNYDYYLAPSLKAFCLSVTKQGVSSASSSSSTGTAPGKCVQNLVANPSVNGASQAFFGAAGSTFAANTKTIATDRAHEGTSSLKTVISATGQASSMAKAVSGTRLNVGESMSWSFWMYSTKGGSVYNIIEALRVSDGVYQNYTDLTSISPNTWTKISGTWSPPYDMTISQVGFYNLQVVSGDTIWFDEITVHRGDKLYKYGDGDMSGGFWTGAANGSSSVNLVTAE